MKREIEHKTCASPTLRVWTFFLQQLKLESHNSANDILRWMHYGPPKIKAGLPTHHYAWAELDHCTGLFLPPTESRKGLNKCKWMTWIRCKPDFKRHKCGDIAWARGVPEQRSQTASPGKHDVLSLGDFLQPLRLCSFPRQWKFDFHMGVSICSVNTRVIAERTPQPSSRHTTCALCWVKPSAHTDNHSKLGFTCSRPEHVSVPLTSRVASANREQQSNNDSVMRLRGKIIDLQEFSRGGWWMVCWKRDTISNFYSMEAIMNTGKHYHSIFLATFV